MTSLLKWLKKANPPLKGKLPNTKNCRLPDPNAKETETDAAACASANAEFDASMCKTAASKSKRIRLQYRRYGSEMLARMAKYVDLHGLQAASRHFSYKLGHEIYFQYLISHTKITENKLSLKMSWVTAYRN